MKREFERLKGAAFDVLIFGGGVYGAWAAYDAALRGLRVALVEQGDWASATSSSSSKLVHGGLRYLETYDFKLVRKALAERRRLLDNAPHRVWPLRFGVPVYADSRVGMLRLKAGLVLYDLLAGRPEPAMSHRRFGRGDFWERFPILESSGLRGGFTYVDAQTDDARLVLELVDGALAHGAVCVNYCRMDRLVEQGGQATGAVLRDCVSGEEIEVSARQFVNATGNWMARESGEKCRLTKGVHLVLPASGLREALLLTAKSDGRVFFVIPWYGRTLLGTTDTDYRGSLDRVTVDTEDVGYLLAAANRYLKRGWTEQDVIGSYAGVRTLKSSDVAAPSAASRDWKLEVAPNGVHYSIGGKLTSAREDAAVIVDSVCARLGLARASDTPHQPFPWKPEGSSAESSAGGTLSGLQSRAVQLGLDEECAVWLVRRHGRRADEVLNLVAAEPGTGARIVPDLAFTYADLLYCARHEMVVHLADLLRRRMPLLILARLGAGRLRELAVRVAPIFGWDDAAIEREVRGCGQPAAQA
jgi:glycerol-3-phosphate dehydrogenase